MNVASVALAIVSVAAVRRPANETGKRERHDDAREALQRRHPHSVGGIERRAGNAANAEIDVDDDRRDREQCERDDRRSRSDAEPRQEQHQDGEARQRAADARQREDRAAQGAAIRRPATPSGKPDDQRQRERGDGEREMLGDVRRQLGHARKSFCRPGGETRPRQAKYSMITAALRTTPPAPVVSLDDPSLYISRELSWLEFNDRVLEEALDERNPLLERLEVRRDLRNQSRRVLHDPRGGDQAADRGRSRPPFRRRPHCRPSSSPRSRSGCARRCSRRCALLNDDLLPGARARGHPAAARLASSTTRRRARWSARSTRRVFPVLTPLAVDSGHPFPYISNLSLSLAVELEETTRDGVELHFARVKIPPTLPRFVPVEGAPPGERRFVLLEDLIAHHLDVLFPGMHVRDVVPVPRHARRRPRSARRRSRRSAARDRVGAAAPPLRRAGALGDRARHAGVHARLAAATRSSSTRVDCYEIDGMMALSDLWQIVNLPGYERCTTRRSRRRFRSA